MKIRKNILAAAFLSAAAISVPASAQVAGIATADTAVAITRSKALGTAYQQIGTQYAAVAQQLQAKRVEINNLNAQLDTNKDKELTQAELDVAIKAKNPLLTQLDAKQKEINTLQEPVFLAQLYAVEQIALKYDAAQQAVITAKKINVILAPDAFVWAPEAVDVTAAITAELDKVVPSVPITPPAGWRPSRQIGALYQQIQQLINAASQQAQAAAAQAQTAAPASPAAQPESR
ncbi:MAG: OmpH family outer membrane protein [Sphingorhabdus sp.]|jgi:Skp family chaperone for outer membrane proteins|uniref:OmpH family outer membrane protein n=1 Tax=Sphingorhabdus sp. TaxID=1902408 RepID=UPI0025EFFD54|nr:OmpH family outer membrane protein [Sphingorhabdus sp.]MCO4091858.1 OmpH family outer membrane protein [Sphingorhabdus sp.]